MIPPTPKERQVSVYTHWEDVYWNYSVMEEFDQGSLHTSKKHLETDMSRGDSAYTLPKSYLDSL